MRELEPAGASPLEYPRVLRLPPTRWPYRGFVDEHRPCFTVDPHGPAPRVPTVSEPRWLSVNGKADRQIILGSLRTTGVYVPGGHSPR